MLKLTCKPYKHLNIKNIIFDLGGVILDIDYQRTLNEFKKTRRKQPRELIYPNIANRTF